MHNKLIKYLEENFNAISIPAFKVEGSVESFNTTLGIKDLPEVVEAFKGELQIDHAGDALVDNCDNLSLYVRYDISNSAIVVIFNNEVGKVVRNDV